MIESYPQILEKPTVNFFNFTLSKVYQNYKVANLIKFQDNSYSSLDARMAELVDVLDSKSARHTLVVVSFGLTTGQNQKTHKS